MEDNTVFAILILSGLILALSVTGCVYQQDVRMPVEMAKLGMCKIINTPASYEKCK